MTSTRDILIRARNLIREGRKTDAHNLLRALLNQQRDNPHAWRLMVRVARSQEEAIFCLKHVLRLNPGDAWAVNTLLKLRDLHPERPTNPPPRRTPRRVPDLPADAPPPRIIPGIGNKYTLEAVSFLDDEEADDLPPRELRVTTIEKREEPDLLAAIEQAELDTAVAPEEELVTVLTAGAELSEAEAEVFWEDVGDLDALLAEAVPLDETDTALLDDLLQDADEESPTWLVELPSEPRYPIPDWDSITDTYPHPELVENAGALRAGRIAVVVVLAAALLGLGAFALNVFLSTPLDVPAIGDAHATTKNVLITPGTTLGDELPGAFEAHNYFIDVSEGQQITVRVDGIAGANPEAFIYTPDGQNVLAYDDDSGGGEAALLSLSVPKEGRYIIRVRLWEPGAYRLEVR